MIAHVLGVATFIVFSLAVWAINLSRIERVPITELQVGKKSQSDHSAIVMIAALCILGVAFLASLAYVLIAPDSPLRSWACGLVGAIVGAAIQYVFGSVKK
jgi:predicted lysophospholipase L1 biosynthesis ABC-type transport system permease subunit